MFHSKRGTAENAALKKRVCGCFGKQHESLLDRSGGGLTGLGTNCEVVTSSLRRDQWLSLASEFWILAFLPPGDFGPVQFSTHTTKRIGTYDRFSSWKPDAS